MQKNAYWQTKNKIYSQVAEWCQMQVVLFLGQPLCYRVTPVLTAKCCSLEKGMEMLREGT